MSEVQSATSPATTVALRATSLQRASAFVRAGVAVVWMASSALYWNSAGESLDSPDIAPVMVALTAFWIVLVPLSLVQAIRPLRVGFSDEEVTVRPSLGFTRVTAFDDIADVIFTAPRGGLQQTTIVLATRKDGRKALLASSAQWRAEDVRALAARWHARDEAIPELAQPTFAALRRRYRRAIPWAWAHPWAVLAIVLSAFTVGLGAIAISMVTSRLD